MNGLQRRIIYGEPLRVDNRQVIPEAKVWSLEFKQAGIERNSLEGSGFHWSWARPTALIERLDGAERRIPIVNWNLRLEMALLIAAIVLPLALTFATELARRAPIRRVSHFLKGE